jgi:hypothetical protein
MRQTVNQKKNKISNVFLSLILIIIGYFLLRDGLGLNLPIELVMFVYLIGFLLLKSDDLVLFFVFLVPLSTGSLLYFLNVLFGIMFIFKNIYKIRINRALIIGWILILWEAIHLLPNALLGFNESIVKLFGFSLTLIIIIMCISNEKLRPSFVKLVFSWCIGFGSLCGILMVKYVHLFGLSNFNSIIRRFGWIPDSLSASSTALIINPNLLGRLSILSVFCLLNILKFEQKHTKKIILISLYFITFGLLSGSRSFLLIMSILTLIYIIEIILNLKSNKNMGVVLFVTGVVLIIFTTKFMGTTIDMLSQRVQSENITGSRDIIYANYIDTLSNSFYVIFGSGMQDYTAKFNIINSNIISSTHNVILEVFAIWGIIGFIIVTKLFISIYKSLKIRKSILKRTCLPYLPLLGLFLSAQFGQFFISYYHTLPTLILGFVSIKYADEKTNKLD